MILVADSGSTKTNWIAINDEGKIHFKIDTQGLNPAVFSRDTLYNRIVTKEELNEVKDRVSKIFFYGAGCGTANAVKFLRGIFMEIFKNADIEI